MPQLNNGIGKHQGTRFPLGEDLTWASHTHEHNHSVLERQRTRPGSCYSTCGAAMDIRLAGNKLACAQGYMYTNPYASWIFAELIATTHSSAPRQEGGAQPAAIT